MNKILKNTVILTIITLVSGVALGGVYQITKEPIAKAQEEAKQEAYQQVFEDADAFEVLKVDAQEAADAVASAGVDDGAVIDEAVEAIQGGEVIGNRVRVKVVKNKIAPPFKEAEFDIMFGKGISKVGDILDLAVKENIIEKSGAWFAYNGSKIGQGRENSKQYLSDNPEMCAEVEAKVRTRYELPGSEETAEAEETKAKELKKGTRAEASKAPGAKTEGADTPDAPRLS